MAEKTVKVILDDNESIELKVIKGTIGPDVIDIAPLLAKGYFTYDPGFIVTASCESKITFIDGDKGLLLHRGYPIEQLAEKSNYLELCYLLLHGELPENDAYINFVDLINNHTMVTERMSQFIHGFRADSHPMAIMCGLVGALSSFYHEKMDISDANDRLRTAVRIVAKMPTLAAMSFKYALGHPFIYPKNSLSFTENFLHMMYATPTKSYKVNPLHAHAMDVIFMLHADHEQNASTSTVRLAGSTNANPYACIASGVAALWGPLHGGANEAVIHMLDQIGTVDNIDTYIKKAKDPKDPFRLMGFGHRVYKNFDPRAHVLRGIAKEVLEQNDDPKYREMFAIAQRLEEYALKDSYFIEKKLYPNVDFYSGIVLSAMGIPTSMFTVIFAIARSIGWIAHWHEMSSSPGKIGRPRQLYTGSVKRDYPQ